MKTIDLLGRIRGINVLNWKNGGNRESSSSGGREILGKTHRGGEWGLSFQVPESLPSFVKGDFSSYKPGLAGG